MEPKGHGDGKGIESKGNDEGGDFYEHEFPIIT